MFKNLKADDRRLVRAIGVAVLVGPASCFLAGLWLRSALAPSGGTTVPPSPAPSNSSREDWAVELLELHNRYRASAGLPPLAIEGRLGSAARDHARDMATRGVMEHRGGNGSNPAERIARAGYRYASAGENVAMGQATPAEAARSWYDSPPHRSNILGEYTECGAGRSVGADGRVYWCMTFGRPR